MFELIISQPIIHTFQHFKSLNGTEKFEIYKNQEQLHSFTHLTTHTALFLPNTNQLIPPSPTIYPPPILWDTHLLILPSTHSPTFLTTHQNLPHNKSPTHLPYTKILILLRDIFPTHSNCSSYHTHPIHFTRHPLIYFSSIH